jgi:hypothetical protein
LKSSGKSFAADKNGKGTASAVPQRQFKWGL